MIPKLKHFSEKELLRVSSSPASFRTESLLRLDRAREIAGIPFRLTSAYRSSEHEKARGRSGRGAHTIGQAFDVACVSSSDRYRIVSAAISAGFTRIGIGRNFVHMDDSESLPGPVMWHYY